MINNLIGTEVVAPTREQAPTTRKRRKLLAVDEVGKYFERPCISSNTLQSILNFWDSRKWDFPRLYELSKKHLYLASPSTPSERLFSEAGRFYSKKRSFLLPKQLENLCILNSCKE